MVAFFSSVVFFFHLSFQRTDFFCLPSWSFNKKKKKKKENLASVALPLHANMSLENRDNNTCFHKAGRLPHTQGLFQRDEEVMDSSSVTKGHWPGTNVTGQTRQHPSLPLFAIFIRGMAILNPGTNL